MTTKRKSQTGRSSLSLKGATLMVEDDLYWDNLTPFEHQCIRLLAVKGPRLVIDLSRIAFMSSVFVGCLTSFIAKAVHAGKHPVIRVNSDILWLFDMLGKTTMVEVEVA